MGRTTLEALSNLKGRSALITGAAGGLGQVIADTLAEMGADLLLVDRPGSDLDSLSRKIEASWKVQAKSLYCDLELDAQRRELVAQVCSSGQGLSILVNNAAFVGTSGCTV
jgi:short-subunit dehydrogenase